MKKTTRKSISLLLLLLTFISCGYVEDKPVEGAKVFKSDNLTATCKIDTKKLSQIFEEDITSQIDCLEGSFNKLVQYVRREDQDKITPAELKKSLNTFLPKSSDQTEESPLIANLDLLFELNMFILRDSRDYLSTKNVPKLFSLVRTINKYGPTLKRSFNSIQDSKTFSNYLAARSIFLPALKSLSNEILEITKVDEAPTKLEILSFYNKIKDKMSGNFEIEEETIKRYLFIKQILLGGEKNEIHTDEFRSFIRKLPILGSLGTDMINVKAKDLIGDTQKAKFYAEKAKELSSLNYQFESPVSLLNTEELFTIAEELLEKADTDSTIDIRKFQPTLELIKPRFLGGEKDIYTTNDVSYIIKQIHFLTSKLYFNNITYNHFSKLMASTEVIEDIAFSDIKEYDFFSPRFIPIFKENFKRIAVKLRFFRDPKSNILIYKHEYIRTNRGFNELSALKYVAQLLIKAYDEKRKKPKHSEVCKFKLINSEHNIPKGCGISPVELNTILVELKPVLEEAGVWPKNIKTFIRNTYLLSDLFQNTSNGSMDFDEMEAAEYFAMGITARTMADKLYDALKTKALNCVTQFSSEEKRLSCFPKKLLKYEKKVVCSIFKEEKRRCKKKIEERRRCGELPKEEQPQCKKEQKKEIAECKKSFEGQRKQCLKDRENEYEICKHPDLSEDEQKMCLNKIFSSSKKQFNPLFFRDNYYNTFFNKLNYKKTLSLLHKYTLNPLGKNNKKNVALTREELKRLQELLLGIETFARGLKTERGVKPNKDTWLEISDMVLAVGGFINIETAYIRYDTDKDNKISKSEMDTALKTFKNTIKTLLEPYTLMTKEIIVITTKLLPTLDKSKIEQTAKSIVKQIKVIIDATGTDIPESEMSKIMSIYTSEAIKLASSANTTLGENELKRPLRKIKQLSFATAQGLATDIIKVIKNAILFPGDRKFVDRFVISNLLKFVVSK